MSNSKIITYDLCSYGNNYDDLYKYLKSYSVWAKLTESSWFISTDKTCTTIRDEIINITDSDDRIFVAELTGTAAWRNIIGDSDFVKKHI